MRPAERGVILVLDVFSPVFVAVADLNVSGGGSLAVLSALELVAAGDLWLLLRGILELRGEDTVRVTEVKVTPLIKAMVKLIQLISNAGGRGTRCLQIEFFCLAPDARV